MKKYISILLIVCISLANVYIPVYSRETQTLPSNNVNNIQYDLEGFFGCIYIEKDSKAVTVDGHASTLSDILNISKRKSKRLLKSKKALRNFCSNTPYEFEETESSWIITNPYQTKRIMVYTNNLTDNYGATKQLYYYGAYTLEYSTEEDTAVAYEQLLNTYGSNNVVLDEVFSIYSSWQDEYASLTSYQYLPNIRTNMYPLITSINDYMGSKNDIVVAVIDSGYDTDSSIYADRFITDKCASFITDSDSEGNVVEDNLGHGSQVCFTLANCSPDNVKIIAYKVFDDTGKTSMSVVRNALIQAYKDGVDIVNMSFGGDSTFIGFNMEMRALYNAGVSIFAAAGNDGTETVDDVYPANSKYAIAVSSISNTINNGKYTLSTFSTYGSSVKFSAPGEHLCLLSNDGNMYYCSGTSYATPLLVAQLATLRTFITTSSVDEDISLMKQYISPDFDSDYLINPEYRSNSYGYGYLDLSNITVCDCGKSNCHVIYHTETTETETTMEITTDAESSNEIPNNEETTLIDIETESNNTNEDVSADITITVPNTIEIPTTNPVLETTICETTTIEESAEITTSSTLKIKQPKKVKIKVKKRSVTIKFKKRNVKDNVEINYSKTKKFKTYKIILTYKKRVKIKFKKKGIYYVRLRSYRVINGSNYYSKYTKKKKVKVK